MRFATLVAAMAAIFFSFSNLARAEEATVNSNRTTAIGHLAVYDKWSCGNPAKPTMTLSPQPAHGTIRFEWRAGPLGKKAKGGCAGKRTFGMVVWYTPHSGYRGKDYTKIGLRSYFHGTNSYYHAWKFNITVK